MLLQSGVERFSDRLLLDDFVALFFGLVLNFKLFDRGGLLIHSKTLAVDLFSHSEVVSPLAAALSYSQHERLMFSEINVDNELLERIAWSKVGDLRL